MKKICLLMICAFLLCSRETENQSKYETRYYGGNPNFKTIEKFWGNNNTIIYDTHTRVMYLILNDSRYTSTITPLYNADGSLRTYDGE